MTFFHTLDEVAPPGAISGQQYPWVVLIAIALVIVAADPILRAHKKKKRTPKRGKAL